MHHGDDRRTMPMTADDIVVHPALEPCVRAQAQSPLSIQEVSPRIASLFATQQRWLMAHAALAQYFRNEAAAVGTGLLAEHFLELVERHELASRNTASALLKEMLKYHIVRFGANGEGRRYRPLEPAPAVLMALFHWHALHLATLDGLDGGARAARLRARPALLGAIQPLIADGLIGSGEALAAEDLLAVHLDRRGWHRDGSPDRRLPARHRGPRAHSDRRDVGVHAGAAAQSVANAARPQIRRGRGDGKPGLVPGKSLLWVSADFRREYHAAQAVKLAIIDAAFEACVTRGQHTEGEATPG
jgi:hypothetical protein